MIAAGTILLPGVEVPNGQLWGGNPGVYMRDLTAEDIVTLKEVSWKLLSRAKGQDRREVLGEGRERRREVTMN